MRKTKSITVLLVSSAMLALQSMAAVTVIHEYLLGEAGSLGTNNRPLDNVGSADFASGGPASVGTAGVSAPGSTAYLTGSGGASGPLYYGAPTSSVNNNVAYGVYARASALSAGTVFTTGGGNGMKINLGSDGWASSVHNVTVVGPGNGITNSFTANAWVHLAIVVRNDQAGVFIDGVDTGLSYDNSGDTITFGGLHLLTSPGGGSRFAGDVDLLKIVTFDAVDDNDASVISALQVPEPSSTGLLGLGGLALILRRRK